MKCPTCKLITSEVWKLDKTATYGKRLIGVQRLRCCVICQTEFKTFTSCTGPQAFEEIVTNYTDLCDCGNVVRHKETVRVLLANSHVQTKVDLLLCDSCHRLEIESRRYFERFGITEVITTISNNRRAKKVEQVSCHSLK